MTLPSSDTLLDNDCGWPANEIPVHVEVNGTTFRATYEVKDAAVLLASPEFGDASAALDGQVPEIVAARLLREAAEAAMARGGAQFMRDDGTKVPSP